MRISRGTRAPDPPPVREGMETLLPDFILQVYLQDVQTVIYSVRKLGFGRKGNGNAFTYICHVIRNRISAGYAVQHESYAAPFLGTPI